MNVYELNKKLSYGSAAPIAFFRWDLLFKDTLSLKMDLINYNFLFPNFWKGEIPIPSRSSSSLKGLKFLHSIDHCVGIPYLFRKITVSHIFKNLRIFFLHIYIHQRRIVGDSLACSHQILGKFLYGEKSFQRA